MDKKCPSCGNTDEFRPTLVNDEYICEECGTEFSEISQEAYTSPNYRLFCERVVTKMRANINDAIIASAIGELAEGYINDGPEYAKDFIGRLSGIASDLYVDYKAGLREQYDFSAIMEGVERLIELHNMQNPEDITFSSEENENAEHEKEENEGSEVEVERPSEVFGDQGQDNLDPLSMIDDDTPPAERTEHLALATLKGNVENLKNTIAMLDAAEQQEKEMVGMDADRLGGEGAAHEEKEAELMDKIKDAVSQLQLGLDGYLQNEVNPHYNAPELRNKVDSVVAQANSEAMDEAIKAQITGQLKELCAEACGMLSECGYPVSEDAQLVSQGDVDAQLANSIDINTQEMSNTVDEAVVGGQNVDADLLTPEAPMPYDLPPEPDPDDYSGDVGFHDEHPKNDVLGDEIENIPVDDDSQDDQFRKGQTVVFEEEFWTITGIKEASLFLESDNGETIETDKANVELSNREGFDAMEEHYVRGTDNLRKIWEGMEESIDNSEALLMPVRRFDLREGRFKGLKPSAGDVAIPLPKGYTPAEQKAGFDPSKTLGKHVDVDSEAAPRDSVQSIATAKKKSSQGKIFDIVRITATPKEGGDSKVIYDAVGIGDKFYLRKSVRKSDNTDVSPPVDLLKAEPRVKLINTIMDATDIDPSKMADFESKLDAITNVKEALLPNSNVQPQ